MRNSIIILLLTLLLCTTPAYANQTNSKDGPTLADLTAADKTKCQRDFKKISKAFKLCDIAEKTSNHRKKVRAFKKAVPILEKVKEKTSCSRIATLVDQEILKIKKLEKLEGKVYKEREDLGGGEAPFMWGPYF